MASLRRAISLFLLLATSLSSSLAQSTLSPSISSFSPIIPTPSPSHHDLFPTSGLPSPTSTPPRIPQVPTSTPSNTYDPDEETANNLVNMYFLILAAFVIVLVVAAWYWRKGRQRKLQAVADRQHSALQRDLELGGWRRVGASGGWFRRREESGDERDPPPPYTAVNEGANTEVGTGTGSGIGTGTGTTTAATIMMPPAAHVPVDDGAGAPPKYDELVGARLEITAAAPPATDANSSHDESEAQNAVRLGAVLEGSLTEVTPAHAEGNLNSAAVTQVGGNAAGSGERLRED